MCVSYFSPLALWFPAPVFYPSPILVLSGPYYIWLAPVSLDTVLDICSCFLPRNSWKWAFFFFCHHWNSYASSMLAGRALHVERTCLIMNTEESGVKQKRLKQSNSLKP